MGGGPIRSVEQTTTSPQFQVPAALQPLIGGSVAQATQAQTQLPLTSFLGPQVKAVPGPTPQETALINQLLGLAGQPIQPLQQQGEQALQGILTQPLTGPEQSSLDFFHQAVGQPLTPPQTAALSEAGLWLGTPLGESPATKAGMEAWRQQVLPLLKSEAAFRGNLGGGGFLEDLFKESSAAAVPLIQQELSQRAALMPFLANLGGTQYQQAVGAATAEADLGRRATQVQQDVIKAMTDLGGLEFQQIVGVIAQALQAAGLPRQVSADQFQAVYDDFLRRQALSESVTTGPLGAVLPTASIPGAARTGTQTQRGGGFFGK